MILVRYIIHNKIKNSKQYTISISLILIVASVCFLLSDYISYTAVALILLMFVSLNAMFFDIAPVLFSAFLSAIIWIWFFIPPIFTWVVKSTSDKMMIVMYFVVALVNTVLTIKLRALEKAANKKEEKENTLKLYNTLLNSLSHELRTPISTIIAATDNLESANNHLTEDMKKELIHEISKASIRLNSQVENLLNMSRLESDYISIKMDWCDVNDLIHHVVNVLNERLENRKVEIRIDETIPLCKLDYGLMEQILQNLIINSHLYTPINCKISISSWYKNDNLYITVEDDGQGFPENEIEFVFDKFYRLKHSKTGGTGLGLSIAKGFVEAHHGTITLKNNSKGGAFFSIIIPSDSSYINSYENE